MDVEALRDSPLRDAPVAWSEPLDNRDGLALKVFPVDRVHRPLRVAAFTAHPEVPPREFP